jgi:hypothetical protein
MLVPRSTKRVFKVFKVVQVLWRGADPECDVWLDICADLVPDDKADAFDRVITSFDRVGEKCCEGRHVLCAPKEHGTEDGLTKTALDEMRAFDLTAYEDFAPPHDAPRFVLGRYVIYADY